MDLRAWDFVSHFYDVRAFIPKNIVIVNERAFQRLPEAQRRALLQAGNPALMLHAGDLVASRDDLTHDDEWGEWNQAGGWAYAAIAQLTAAGNHEYLDTTLPDGSASRQAQRVAAQGARQFHPGGDDQPRRNRTHAAQGALRQRRLRHGAVDHHNPQQDQ